MFVQKCNKIVIKYSLSCMGIDYLQDKIFFAFLLLWDYRLTIDYKDWSKQNIIKIKKNINEIFLLIYEYKLKSSVQG